MNTIISILFKLNDVSFVCFYTMQIAVLEKMKKAAAGGGVHRSSGVFHHDASSSRFFFPFPSPNLSHFFLFPIDSFSTDSSKMTWFVSKVKSRPSERFDIFAFVSIHNRQITKSIQQPKDGKTIRNIIIDMLFFVLFFSFVIQSPL